METTIGMPQVGASSDSLLIIGLKLNTPRREILTIFMTGRKMESVHATPFPFE
jgi:hypothetical protein